MARHRPRAGFAIRRLALGLAGLLGPTAGGVVAQEPPGPPPAGLPTLPSAVADLEAPTAREAALEARIRQLESLVNQLSARVDSVQTTPPGAATGESPVVSPAPEPFGTVGSAEEPPPEEIPRINMPAPPRSFSLKAAFGNGFGLSTEDEEFTIQFHNLTQIDYRGYWDTPNLPLNDLYRSTFGVPRQWWVFSGRIGKPFEYSVVPAFGFDSINLLDAFLNVRFDDRLQVKIGRYKTPFTYEFYNLPVNGLISPERSLFFNNFGLNRDVGIMAWGQLFQKRLDYSAGIFNGIRNYFVDRNSSPEIAAYVNLRPFETWHDSPLQFLNLGGSVLAGNEMNTPIPQLLRTNVATTGSSFYGVPFFGFNNDVIESGPRALWDLHAAWYRGPLSVIAEWSSGFQDYARTSSAFRRTRLPIDGWYAQAGYFLTGETVAARGMVRPRSNFDLRPGKFGLGAVELTGRWSDLQLGQQVFTAGLADPNLWTNHASLLDVGLNWYWTQYVKVYLGWQHAMFASPAFLEPGRYQKTNDMLWARFQIFF